MMDDIKKDNIKNVEDIIHCLCIISAAPLDIGATVRKIKTPAITVASA
jgi:hypothetical protein